MSTEEKGDRMKQITNALLFGGCLVAAGIANSANADITYGGWVESHDYGNYQQISGPTFDWSYENSGYNFNYSYSASGDQDGIEFASTFGYGGGAFFGNIQIMTDVAVTWEMLFDFNYSYGNPSILVIDQDWNMYTLEHGDELLLEPGKQYSVQTLIFGTLSFGTPVPAPSVLLIFGSAIATTRRRRV